MVSGKNTSSRWKRKQRRRPGTKPGAKLKLSEQSELTKLAERAKQRLISGVGLMLDCEVDLVVPISRATRWRLRKLKLFPEPVKLGNKRVAYRVADIAAVVAGTWQPAAAA